MAKKHSNRLKVLIQDWIDEKEHYDRIANRWLAAVSILSSLNSEIWHQCQKEGIDINSLKLNENGKATIPNTKS